MLFIKAPCGLVVTAHFKKYVFYAAFTTLVKKIGHKKIRRTLFSVCGEYGYAVKFAFVRNALPADIAHGSVVGAVVTDKGGNRPIGQNLRLDTAACPWDGEAFFFDHSDIAA